MPMFPAADETVLQRWMRRIEEDFGDAFLQVIGDGVVLQQQQKSVEARQPTPTFNSNPNEKRSGVPNSEHAPRQYREPPSQVVQDHPDNHDKGHLVRPSQPASYSNDRLGHGVLHSSPVPLPRRKYERTMSPIPRHEFDPTPQSRKEGTNQTQIPTTPTSILKKSRLGREFVAQIMEVLPPAATTVASPPGGTSSVLKFQSTTRQSIMQEIAYVNHLLATMTNSDGRRNTDNNHHKDNNREYYTEHLWSLKEQLRCLTTIGNEDKRITYDGTTVNQVMHAAESLKADELIAEMDEIVGPAPSIRITARHSSPSPKCGGDSRLESNTRQGLRRRSKERNVPRAASPRREEERQDSALERGLSTGPDEATKGASIPKVVSYERCRASSHAAAAQQWDDDDLSNSIVERETSDGGPTVAKDILSVRVVAPANLPGGYQIDAELNNESFQVTVPKGGVSIGQTFEVKPTHTTRNAAGESSWKAGLFDCFALGIVHPIFCNSFFCPQGKCISPLMMSDCRCFKDASHLLIFLLPLLHLQSCSHSDLDENTPFSFATRTACIVSTQAIAHQDGSLIIDCIFVVGSSPHLHRDLACEYCCQDIFIHVVLFVQHSCSSLVLSLGGSNQTTGPWHIQYPNRARSMGGRRRHDGVSFLSAVFYFTNDATDCRL